MRAHGSRYPHENPDAPPYQPYRGVNPERGCRFMTACAALAFLLTVGAVLYLVLR